MSLDQLTAVCQSVPGPGGVPPSKYISCAQQSGLAAAIANSRPKLVVSAAERREVFIIDYSKVRAYRLGRSKAAIINRFGVIALAEMGEGTVPTLLRVSSA